MQFAHQRSATHHGLDLINDAILATLHTVGMPFKDVADGVLARAYPKKLTRQGEEKLRLRIYEQLQQLVHSGQVVRMGSGAEKVYSRV